MDLECMAEIGRTMELIDRSGVGLIVRVIPDPAKDIGFAIISLFHFHQPVKIHTRENLAEAIKCLLLIESAAPVSAD